MRIDEGFLLDLGLLEVQSVHMELNEPDVLLPKKEAHRAVAAAERDSRVINEYPPIRAFIVLWMAPDVSRVVVCVGL